MTEGTRDEAASQMFGRSVFEILAPALADGCAARLGRLSFAQRKPIETPSYIAITSRGAVPHLTPDNVARHTSFNAAYMALEDFIERKQPPVYTAPRCHGSGRLQSFTATPSDRTIVLGARRCPPIVTPMGNGAKYVTLFTSTGFANVKVSQYAAAVHDLQPDIVIPLSDSFHTSTTPASRKLVKMVGRTEEWLDDFLRQLESEGHREEATSSVFAPLLPVELPLQWEYVRHLAEDVREKLSGLAVYNASLMPELKAYEPLASLPKLSFDLPKSPQDILRQIALGVDMLALPLVNSASDAGVALTFSFPPTPTEAETPRPLGINMWSAEHRMAVTPLLKDCSCYACTNHHRAYVQHLLNAKEMLGWNLLQIHNHHVVDKFFEGVRGELQKGTQAFTDGCEGFAAAYVAELPQGTGDRPRARGYHFKSEAGQEKINKAAWVADFQDKILGEETAAVSL